MKILPSKWNRRKKERKKEREEIIKNLVKYGYNHSEIARLLGYDNSMISKIMKVECLLFQHFQPPSPK